MLARHAIAFVGTSILSMAVKVVHQGLFLTATSQKLLWFVAGQKIKSTIS